MVSAVPAQNTITDSTKEAPGSSGVLLFRQALQGVNDRPILLLQMTVAYLLSSHVRFIFPVRSEHVSALDSAFDEVIPGLTLDSKGIVYVKDCPEDHVAQLVGSAALVISDCPEVEAQALALKRPFVSLSKGDANALNCTSKNLGLMPQKQLRANLNAYLRLIRLQSAGFSTSGDLLFW